MAKAKSPRAKKVKEVVEAKPEFAVTLKLGDMLLQGTGKTVLEALKSLPIPVKITTKSILTVEHGEKKHQRGMTIPDAKKLFYPASQIYWAKNFSLLLK